MSAGMTMLRAALVIALGACASARPQTPDTQTPEREIRPAEPPGPPATATVPTVSERELARLDLACQTGPMSHCAEVIDTLDGRELPPELQLRVAFERARVDAWRAVEPDAIGIVLPLSGPYARYGEAAKQAIDLALGDHSANLRVLVRDSTGDAETAARLATELALHEHVAVVLGPIGRRESAAVAEVARFFEVPHLPLTSEVPLPELGDRADPVVRIRTNAKELVTALARHARTELRSERAAILFTDDDAGRASAMVFRAELERLGGAIVREVPLDPAAKSFDEALQTLVGLEPTARRNRQPRGIRPDFDTLFIRAEALTVRRLAPALSFWGIHPRTIPGDESRVQLLGDAGWNSPIVVDKGEHLTDNAVFVAVYAPDDPDAQTFAKRFYLRYERRPSAFQAESRDATKLLVEALRAIRAAPPPATRASILQAFLAPRFLVGATGEIEVAAGGEIRPRAHLMTVDGDELRRRHSEEEELARRTAPTPSEKTP